MYFSFSVRLVFWDLSVFATELLLGNFPKNFIFKEKYWENGNGGNFSSSSWSPQFLSFKIGLTKTTFKTLTQSFLVGYRRQSLEKLWKNFFFPTYLPRHMEEIIYNVQGVILVTRLMLPLEDYEAMFIEDCELQCHTFLRRSVCRWKANISAICMFFRLPCIVKVGVKIDFSCAFLCKLQESCILSKSRWKRNISSIYMFFRLPCIQLK